MGSPTSLIPVNYFFSLATNTLKMVRFKARSCKILSKAPYWCRFSGKLELHNSLYQALSLSHCSSWEMIRFNRLIFMASLIVQLL